MLIRVCRYKNASVAGYAEAFRSVQSDSPTSNWYSYFENNVLVQRKLSFCHIDLPDFSYAALSSIAVATATPHSFALHMRKSSYVNIAET